MNLIEAIQSGKPFRRQGHEWRKGPEMNENVNLGILLSYEDIIAEDWEIKEQTVTITKSQFFDALDWAFRNSLGACHEFKDVGKLAAIHLGFYDEE